MTQIKDDTDLVDDVSCLIVLPIILGFSKTIRRKIAHEEDAAGVILAKRIVKRVEKVRPGKISVDNDSAVPNDTVVIQIERLPIRGIGKAVHHLERDDASKRGFEHLWKGKRSQRGNSVGNAAVPMTEFSSVILWAGLSPNWDRVQISPPFLPNYDL